MLKRLLLCVLMLAAPAMAAADEWEGGKESHGIRVWTRIEPGSAVRAFKASMIVKTTLSGLVNLIQDTDNANRWVYSTDRILMLKQDVEKGTFVVRAEMNFPWPLTDRDVIVAGQVVQDERTLTVTINSHGISGPEYPVDPNYVRMPTMEGTWIFRPLGSGMVEVTMIGHADPGGHIPPGIVNMLIDMTPRKTLEGMRRLLPDPRYQKTTLPQIREPGGRSGP
ncbi:MAG TPA: START domain-containing protein [Moraxellaceae bacterium]|nr:START domain-containing protein [Moraxellaceae bacterium]